MKSTSTSHLPYKWDKLGMPKKSYKEDGLSCTRKHFKKATPGMEHVASTPRPAHPYNDG